MIPGKTANPAQGFYTKRSPSPGQKFRQFTVKNRISKMILLIEKESFKLRVPAFQVHHLRHNILWIPAFMGPPGIIYLFCHTESAASAASPGGINLDLPEI